MPLLVHKADVILPLSEETRQDISDILLSSLLVLPKGYNLHARNRKERRHNKSLLRDHGRLPLVAIGKDV